MHFLVRAKFIEEFTLRSMRLKQEKWAKLVISDEQRRHLESFLDQSEKTIIIDHLMFPRHAADSYNFTKHWWPTPDTHRLADTSQVKTLFSLLFLLKYSGTRVFSS